MPCEGMSFEQGKHTNWTAAGEEQQLVKIHTKQGGGWVKNKSQISWTTALPFLYQADPKNGIDRARRTQTTHRWAGFESPWLRKSCFNNPNPYPRAPEGFTPPVLHLCPFTFRKMEFSLPIMAKSKVCPSCHGRNPLKADRPGQGQKEGKQGKECLKIWEIDSKLNQPSQGEVLNGVEKKKGVKFEAFVIQMLFILVRRRGLWEIQHYLT